MKYIVNKKGKKIFNGVITRYEKNDFILGRSEGDAWFYKKYNNGLIEMYHKITIVNNIVTEYYTGNYISYYQFLPIYNYPVILQKVISITSQILASSNLTNVTIRTITNNSYSAFIFDNMKKNEGTCTLYTKIVGMWK